MSQGGTSIPGNSVAAKVYDIAIRERYPFGGCLMGRAMQEAPRPHQLHHHSAWCSSDESDPPRTRIQPLPLPGKLAPSIPTSTLVAMRDLARHPKQSAPTELKHSIPRVHSGIAGMERHCDAAMGVSSPPLYCPVAQYPFFAFTANFFSRTSTLIFRNAPSIFAFPETYPSR